jgi:hypothetical protein
MSSLVFCSGCADLFFWYMLQIKCFKEHSAGVTDISFDATAEYLASCSADGTIAVCSPV